MWSASRKTAGPFGGLVAADALEDAGAVVETVDADVNRRVRPVDELAVHPDLLGLLHRGSSVSASVTKCYDVGSCTTSTGRAARQADELGWRQPDHVRLGAGADPDSCGAEQRPLDQDAATRSERERRYAARTEARRAPRPRAAPATVARRAPATPCDLAAVGPAVARHERQHRRPRRTTKTSDLTIWRRSQPIASAAPARSALPSANSSSRASAPASRRKRTARRAPTGSAARPPCRSRSAELDEADVVEALGVQLVDELGRGRRVDRERPSAPCRPPSSARRPCWRC